MHFSSLFRVERNARRLTEILAILGKYGLADWLGASITNGCRPARQF